MFCVWYQRAVSCTWHSAGVCGTQAPCHDDGKEGESDAGHWDDADEGEALQKSMKLLVTMMLVGNGHDHREDHGTRIVTIVTIMMLVMVI